MVSVSRLVAVDRPLAAGESTTFHMNVDYVAESYFTEARFYGHGPSTPQYDFVSAIRQFIF